MIPLMTVYVHKGSNEFSCASNEATQPLLFPGFLISLLGGLLAIFLFFPRSLGWEELSLNKDGTTSFSLMEVDEKLLLLCPFLVSSGSFQNSDSEVDLQGSAPLLIVCDQAGNSDLLSNAHNMLLDVTYFQLN